MPRRAVPLPPPFSIKPNGTYLITGAFGGFGKVIARWLVKSGARHLVLTGRGFVAVRVDGKALTTVRVDGARLYTLVTQKRASDGLLDLSFTPGLSAYAFTFG